MNKVIFFLFIMLALNFRSNSQNDESLRKPSSQIQENSNFVENFKQEVSTEEEQIEYTRLGVPKIVWAFWNKELGENDHFLKLFVENRKKYAKGWIIRELNEVTAWHWLNQIPDFDNALNRPEFKNQVLAKQCDLVRFALLKHFGGVYMDFTTILVESLDWIENLDQQEAIDYRFGEGPDVFILYNSDTTERDSAIDPETGHRFMTNPSLEVSFIVAKPKTKYLQEVFDLFVFGRKKGYQMYGKTREKSYLVDVIKKEDIRVGSFAGNYFEVGLSCMITINRKQRQFDELFKNGTDKVQRFAMKHYNIWVTGTNTSAFYYHKAQSENFILILSQSDITLMKNQDSFPRYYIKLISLTSRMLKNYLITDKKILDKLPCKWDYLILENSILNRYLLSNYNKNFTYNPFVTDPYAHGCIDMKKGILKSFPRKIYFGQVFLLVLIVMIATLASAAAIFRFSSRARRKLSCLFPKVKQDEISITDSFEMDKKDESPMNHS